MSLQRGMGKGSVTQLCGRNMEERLAGSGKCGWEFFSRKPEVRQCDSSSYLKTAVDTQES